MLGIDLDKMGDALTERVISAVSERILVPIVTQVRAELCKAIAGDVPAAFGDELDRQGLSLPAETQAVMWRAAIAAAASIPASAEPPAAIA